MVGKELFLLRHGDTGMKGRYIGSTNVPVSERGMEQVRKTGRLLHDAGISQIFCSPMLRCMQSLDLLDLSCICIFSDLLREIDFGHWEGKSFDEIVQSDKESVDTWVANPGSFSFPCGESLTAFKKRVEDFATQLRSAADKKMLVVSHGGVIRHLICALLGLPSDNYLLFDVQPGCFSSIRLFPEGGILTGLNIKG